MKQTKIDKQIPIRFMKKVYGYKYKDEPERNTNKDQKETCRNNICLEVEPILVTLIL